MNTAARTALGILVWSFGLTAPFFCNKIGHAYFKKPSSHYFVPSPNKRSSLEEKAEPFFKLEVESANGSLVYCMCSAAKSNYEQILDAYNQLYPVLRPKELADFLFKMDSNNDFVISELESLAVLNHLKKEIELGENY